MVLRDSFTTNLATISGTHAGDLMQGFTTTDEYILTDVELNIYKQGTPGGTLNIKIYSESSDLPNTLLATSTGRLATSIATGINYETFTGFNLTLTNGVKYIITLEGSGASHDASNRILINGASTTLYAGGRAGYNPGTWTLFGVQHDFNFKTYGDDIVDEKNSMFAFGGL